MSQFAIILAAAGQSRRFGDPQTKKVFARIGEKPLWMFAAEAFSQRNDVCQMILLIAADDRQLFNDKYSASAAMLGCETVIGGAERAESVRNGLGVVRDDIEFVAIHDAARPCLSYDLIDRVFDAARDCDAAILASPCHATLKRVDPAGVISETVPRDGLWLAQTPQVFRRQLLCDAYAAHPDPAQATDDASIVEAFGHPVRVVEGSPFNIKVTTPSDLEFAEQALKFMAKSRGFPS